MVHQSLRLTVQYFQFDIGKQWRLLSVSKLNVSLSPWQPILVSLFLSFTVCVCVWHRLFRCWGYGRPRDTHVHPSSHWQSYWSSTDTITPVHTGRNAIIVAGGNGKQGMPGSLPLTLTCRSTWAHTRTHAHSPVWASRCCTCPPVCVAEATIQASLVVSGFDVSKTCNSHYQCKQASGMCVCLFVQMCIHVRQSKGSDWSPHSTLITRGNQL